MKYFVFVRIINEDFIFTLLTAESRTRGCQPMLAANRTTVVLIYPARVTTLASRTHHRVLLMIFTSGIIVSTSHGGAS